MKVEMQLSRQEVQDILEGYVNETLRYGQHMQIKLMTLINFQNDENFCSLEIEPAGEKVEDPPEFKPLFEPLPAPPIVQPAATGSGEAGPVVEHDIPF